MNTDRQLTLLWHAARIDPILKNAVEEVEKEVDRLKAALHEIAYFGVTHPPEMTDAQYLDFTARRMRGIALGAIDDAEAIDNEPAS